MKGRFGPSTASVCIFCLVVLQSVRLCVQPDALFVIVPALALPTKLAAFAYIVTFVIGTVAAMGGYAALIGAWHPLLLWCLLPAWQHALLIHCGEGANHHDGLFFFKKHKEFAGGASADSQHSMACSAHLVRVA